MVNFTSHIGSIVKFNNFFNTSLRFRIKNQNEHLLLFIKDYFSQVIKNQNEHFYYTLKSYQTSKIYVTKIEIKHYLYLSTILIILSIKIHVVF